MPGAFLQFLAPEQIADIQSALSVLTSMITPTLLTSACGTFIVSTSMRQDQVVDRTREISERYEALMLNPSSDRFAAARQDLLHSQLHLLSERATLLQRCLSLFYIASGTFILSSIAIGFSILFRTSYWLPVLLGLVGAALLFYGTALMIGEMRLAVRSLRTETDFHLRLAREHPDLAGRRTA